MEPEHSRKYTEPAHSRKYTEPEHSRKYKEPEQLRKFDIECCCLNIIAMPYALRYWNKPHRIEPMFYRLDGIIG